jgi:syntaxin 5
MTIARSIGNDISASYAKLEKLTLLARRKTMFDDRPREIQELTFIIKEDMNALNRQIGQLQQIAKTQRSQGLQVRGRARKAKT